MRETKVVLSLVGLTALIVLGSLVLLWSDHSVPPELLALAATVSGGVLGWLTRGRYDEVVKVIDQAPVDPPAPTGAPSD